MNNVYFSVFFLLLGLIPTYGDSCLQGRGSGSMVKFSRWEGNPQYFMIEVVQLKSSEPFNFNNRSVDILTQREKFNQLRAELSRQSLSYSINKGSFPLLGSEIMWERFLFLFSGSSFQQKSFYEGFEVEISGKIRKEGHLFILQNLAFTKTFRDSNGLEMIDVINISLIKENNEYTVLAWTQRSGI